MRKEVIELLKVVFKIAFRNFLMRFKSVFVLIFGIGVPSMLLVGGLSLNDSIGRWTKRSLAENFGCADAYVENRRNNIFFKIPLDQQIVDILRKHQKILSVLPVSESIAQIEYGGKILDCLVIATSPEELSYFVEEKIELVSNNILLSKELAQIMDIRENDFVALDMGRGQKQFKVVKISTDGFLNFRGENLQYAGTVFINRDDFQGVGGFPTKIYMRLEGSIEEHKATTDWISEELKVKAVAMKFQLLNSPANRTLGYLTIAFSSFSVIASFILVYVFAQSFVEERSTTMVTLRILGMKTGHLSAILIYEGLIYFLIAGLCGGIMGTFLGDFLLRRLRTISGTLMSEFYIGFSDLTLYVSPLTVFTGILGGLVIPLIIFILKIRAITHHPPVEMLRTESHVRTQRWKRKISGGSMIVLSMVMILIYPKFWLFFFLIAALGGVVVFPTTFLSLGMGIFLVSFIYFPLTQSATVWDILQRGASFFIGSWFLFLSLISPLRKIFSRWMKKGSVSTFIALSYVERNRKNTFIIASMFSLIVFMMTLVLVVPYNMEKFVLERMKTGLFGYDLMVIYNPLKLVLSKGEPDLSKDLQNPSKIYVAQFNDDLIAFVDDNFLKDAVVSIETNKRWREQLLEPGTIVVGDFEGARSLQITGKVKSPFGFGETENMTFRVVDTFDMRQLMVPVKYVASINSIPEKVRLIPVIISRVDPANVMQVKDFYRKRFDFPIYIKEELNRVFSGIDLLIQTGVTLLYFGLISGFSGIAFYSLRNVIVRKRMSGTLRAIGMSGKSLSAAFILENLIVASMGIITGIFAGYLESKDVSNFIFSIFGSGQFSVPIWELAGLILAIYMIISLVVTLPVLVIRTSPVEALRAPD